MIKNILLISAITIFIYSCKHSKKIQQEKYNKSDSNYMLILDIKLRDDTDNMHIEMAFINNNDFPIKISNPSCWINLHPVLEEVKSFNIKENVDVLIKVRVNPSCAKQNFVINQHEEKIFTMPYGLSKLYDINKRKGKLHFYINYLGTITDQNDNILKKFGENIKSNIIEIKH